MIPPVPAARLALRRLRAAESLVLAAVLAFSASCAAQAVSTFPWKDSSGTAMAFRALPAGPAGEEGRFGDKKAKERYVLDKVMRLEAGRSLVVKLRRGGAAGESSRIKLALGADRDAASPLVSATFPMQAEELEVYLLPDAASSVRSLSASVEGGPAAFSIASIEALPAFKGIEAGPSGIRVSSGFSLARGQGGSELSIRKPFSNMGAGSGKGRLGIVLEYGPAPAGSAFRIEARASDGSLRTYSLRTHPRGARTVLDEGIVPADSELLTLKAPAGVEVRAFYSALLGEELYDLADLGRVLLDGASESDYSLFRWDMIPSVLVFDFKDYATQDRYLKRLAFFVEKIGYRGVLAKDEEIASLHGWNAHDYRAEDLAAFFRKARDKAFPLDPEEKELERVLLGAGILREEGGKPSAGSGAMISISRESSAALRWTFAVHESIHAIFFADSGYRGFAQSLWASLEPGEKWFWKAYLGWAGYDAASDYLMGNEFQAYLLQQPTSAAEEYFTKRKAAELLEKHPELSERVGEYMAKYGGSFAQRAKKLESRLLEEYGAEAGRTVFLTRLD